MTAGFLIEQLRQVDPNAEVEILLKPEEGEESGLLFSIDNVENCGGHGDGLPCHVLIRQGSQTGEF